MHVKCDILALAIVHTVFLEDFKLILAMYNCLQRYGNRLTQK